MQLVIVLSAENCSAGTVCGGPQRWCKQSLVAGCMSRRAYRDRVCRDVTQVADGGRLDLQAAAAEAARGLEEIMGPSWRQLISDNLDWGRARWLAAQHDGLQRDVWDEAARPWYLALD